MTPLERGQLRVMRIRAVLAGLVLLAAAAIAEAALREQAVPRGLILGPMLLAVAWLVLAAPQRRWRAWACWALTRAVRPELPGDPRHRVVEPTVDEIDRRLRAFGLPGEAEVWRQVLGADGTGLQPLR